MLAESLQFLFVIFYFLPTCSGITKDAVRVVVLEGGEALFPVSIGMNAERLLFDWKKVGPGGGTLQEVFMYDAGVHYNNGRNGQSEQFKGRVSHFPAELKNGNAAIVIRKTTAADRGNYTCYFPRLQPPQTFYFELDVGAVRVVVPEGGDAVLPLSIGRGAERDYFEWSRVGPGGGTLHEVFKYDFGDHYNNGQPGQSQQFKGRVSHFPAELEHGNASIVIRKTTAADAGNYTCVFPRLKPSLTFYFNLAVAATPKPSVTILTATADRALLQCEVPGASLNTKAEWQSRDGNRLEAEEERVPEEDHVFISLSVNVTRTDLYLCVVSQEDIKHRASAQTFVFINEKESTNTVVIVAITLVVSSAVIIVAVVALLVRRKCIKILHNKGSPLKGEYMINMDDGLIIDVSKQSVKGSALKGREEINMGNGLVRVPSEEPLRPVDVSVTSDEKVCEQPEFPD